MRAQEGIHERYVHPEQKILIARLIANLLTWLPFIGAAYSLMHAIYPTCFLRNGFF
jgi:hypothetical protein